MVCMTWNAPKPLTHIRTDVFDQIDCAHPWEYSLPGCGGDMYKVPFSLYDGDVPNPMGKTPQADDDFSAFQYQITLQPLLDSLRLTTDEFQLSQTPIQPAEPPQRSPEATPQRLLESAWPTFPALPPNYQLPSSLIDSPFGFKPTSCLAAPSPNPCQTGRSIRYRGLEESTFAHVPTAIPTDSRFPPEVPPPPTTASPTSGNTPRPLGSVGERNSKLCTNARPRLLPASRTRRPVFVSPRTPSPVSSASESESALTQSGQPPPLLESPDLRIREYRPDRKLTQPPSGLYEDLRDDPIPPPTVDAKGYSGDDTISVQEPRLGQGDLYNPKYIRGVGQQRQAWCGHCRPGHWLGLKKSAWWYHRSYHLGLNSRTGRPFDKPTRHRTVEGRDGLWEGLCGNCGEWVVLKKNRKTVNSWFRHANKVRVTLIFRMDCPNADLMPCLFSSATSVRKRSLPSPPRRARSPLQIVQRRDLTTCFCCSLVDSPAKCDYGLHNSRRNNRPRSRRHYSAPPSLLALQPLIRDVVVLSCKFWTSPSPLRW